MKQLFLYITLITIAVSAVSCDDFLDLSPISQETTADAYNTASQIEAALTGVYESLTSDAYIWNDNMYGDIRSDNYYAGGDNPEVFEIDYLTISSTNSKVLQSWSNNYNAILKANIVLHYVDDVSDLDDQRKNEIRGEALFMRSFYYFNLVKLFGDIPLVLNVTQSTNPEDVRLPKTPIAEIYLQIIEDLDNAALLLPDVYGNNSSVNKGRATAGAANALIAKAYAQQGNYTMCLEYIQKVEKSGANYELMADYTQLFDGDHYSNSESIFEIQYIGSSASDGNWGPQMFLPPSVSGDAWRKFMTPSHNLVDAYDNSGDVVRKDANILFEEVTWVDEFWQNSSNTSVPFAYKMKDAGGWNSKDHKYLLRYADLLLLKAEALNETGTGDPLPYVNEVRVRAGLDPLNISDKAELKVAILNERRLELAQEAQRWDDLVRNGVVVSTMSNLVEIDLSKGTQVDYDMTEEKIYLPIPQSEIDRNPNLI